MRNLISKFNITSEINNKHRYFNRPILFAKELKKVINDDNINYTFINELSDLEHRGKLSRIVFFHKYQLFRKEKNILWQIIWV